MTESFDTGLPSRNVRDYVNTTRVVDEIVAEVNARSPYKSERGVAAKIASVRYYVIRDGSFTIVYDLPGNVVIYSIEFGSRGRVSGDAGRKGGRDRYDPPVSRIMKWIQKKGIHPARRRSSITGRFIRSYNIRQLAYAISHHIGDYGTKAKHNAPKIWDEVMQIYQPRIDEALTKDMELIMQKIHPELFK